MQRSRGRAADHRRRQHGRPTLTLRERLRDPTWRRFKNIDGRTRTAILEIAVVDPTSDNVILAGQQSRPPRATSLPATPISIRWSADQAGIRSCRCCYRTMSRYYQVEAACWVRPRHRFSVRGAIDPIRDIA